MASGPDPQYWCGSEGAIALAANAAKTVLGVKAHANSGLLLSALRLSFDSVTTTAVPVAVEICRCDNTTNFTIGTNNTATTPRQRSGRTMAAGFTSGKNWTSEPTVLTVVDEFFLSVFMSTMIYDIPLGCEIDQDLNGVGIVVRITTVTASGTPNFRGGLIVERA